MDLNKAVDLYHEHNAAIRELIELERNLEDARREIANSRAMLEVLRADFDAARNEPLSADWMSRHGDLFRRIESYLRTLAESEKQERRLMNEIADVSKRSDLIVCQLKANWGRLCEDIRERLERLNR